MGNDFVKHILFRADAAPHIGIGDLMSLIHLSRYFDETWEVFFIVKNYKAGLDLLAKYKIDNTFVIEKNISVDKEIGFINKVIEEKYIDIVFFEITERKLTDYEGIRHDVKKACVSFDGYILRDIDLVIDWDVEAFKYFSPKKHSKTKFLLGYQFVILPKEFYSNKILQRKHSKDIKKILVAMGGADEFDFTKMVLMKLIEIELELEITIIVGSGYENIDGLKKLAEDTKKQCVIKQNIINMLDEYLLCDVAIGAGGLTSSELVASNTPSLLIATYEHQVARCKFFDEQGWAKYLGFRYFSNDELIAFIENKVFYKNRSVFNTNEIVVAVEELIHE